MAAVMADYLTRELGHETDLSYELLNRIPMWSHAGSKASETLARALQTNRGMRVLVACGYYDTVTPMAVVRKAVEDAPIAPAQRKNLRFENYEGGHMIYTNLPDLKNSTRTSPAHPRSLKTQARPRSSRPPARPRRSRRLLEIDEVSRRCGRHRLAVDLERSSMHSLLRPS